MLDSALIRRAKRSWTRAYKDRTGDTCIFDPLRRHPAYIVDRYGFGVSFIDYH